MKNITHNFVEYIPDTLEEGVLYISIKFSTAVHLCVCGCANKVVTPFSPLDWSLSFNGDSVSLYPSIGNWSFRCQSHYWITENQIVKAKKWKKSKIALERSIDKRQRDKHNKRKKRKCKK